MFELARRGGLQGSPRKCGHALVLEIRNTICVPSQALSITKRDLDTQVYVADIPTYDKRRGRVMSEIPIRLPAEIVYEQFLSNPTKAQR